MAAAGPSRTPSCRRRTLASRPACRIVLIVTMTVSSASLLRLRLKNIVSLSLLSVLWTWRLISSAETHSGMGRVRVTGRSTSVWKTKIAVVAPSFSTRVENEVATPGRVSPGHPMMSAGSGASSESSSSRRLSAPPPPPTTPTTPTTSSCRHQVGGARSSGRDFCRVGRPGAIWDAICMYLCSKKEEFQVELNQGPGIKGEEPRQGEQGIKGAKPRRAIKREQTKEQTNKSRSRTTGHIMILNCVSAQAGSGQVGRLAGQSWRTCRM